MYIYIYTLIQSTFITGGPMQASSLLTDRMQFTEAEMDLIMQPGWASEVFSALFIDIVFYV